MKIWQLNGPLKLEHAPAADLVIDELHDNGKAKAKIIKAPLSLSDMRVFMGGAETKYPLILGRFAVGQITEATPQSYMKNRDRVYLSDVIEDEETESGIKVTGVSVDGNTLSANESYGTGPNSIQIQSGVGSVKVTLKEVAAE